MTKVTGNYTIRLSEYSEFDEHEWCWYLSTAIDSEVAAGTASYRWSALWAAKKAARRHLKGLPPVRKRGPKPTTIKYQAKAKVNL